MKILNLYAGIGGNRKLWGNEHEITAVEIDPKIAEIYQKFFPNDKVVIADAHQFLLDHYNEFDFIWSSPPCPSHSRFNMPLFTQNLGRYPDMKLYEEIIFLEWACKNKIKFVVENVISYYDPLIKPFLLDGHYFWTNFIISNNNKIRNLTNLSIEEMAKERQFNLNDLKDINIEKALRNCVLPKTALHIFNCAFKIKQKTLL